MPGTEHLAGPSGQPESVGQLTDLLREGGYLADRGLATALFVAMSLQRPILLEGEVGVGKTEVAKVLASVFGRKLIRLQCYEGIDTSQALYEWDYTRQMLQIRALSDHQVMGEEAVDKLFGPKFLLERPLLEAVRSGDRSVLLIDEVDRADDEFEAFLLEVLSDFQISIPEIGTIKAESAPLVVLTSNRTRELHDALKRRCLYHWIGYPPAEREVEIVLIREPGISEALARNVVAAVPRHPRRRGEGTRRPRRGAGQPGGDHVRCLAQAPGPGRAWGALLSSGSWSGSRVSSAPPGSRSAPGRP
jgi:MoxR-like ATPase